MPGTDVGLIRQQPQLEAHEDADDAGALTALGFRPTIPRPQIFVHVEFGVSWTPRRFPNSHEFTYQSRSLRHRTANFPPDGPASLTNDAREDMASHIYQTAEQQQIRERHAFWDYREQQRQLAHPSQSHSRSRDLPPESPQEQHLRTPLRYQSRRTLPPVDEERSSRSSRSSRDSHSSHERGHSEPPPLSTSAWGDEVNTPFGFDATRHAAPPLSLFDAVYGVQPAGVWKDLPALPNQYRLGEGLPWSVGHDEPIADPDDERIRPRSQPEAGTASALRQSYANKPTVVPIEAPDVEALRYRVIESHKKRNLEDLSAAMMTVDNGFESQWWYQGLRESTTASSSAVAAQAQLQQHAPLPPRTAFAPGMSALALPVPTVLPASFFGAASDSEADSPPPPPPRLPQQTASLPSSPTGDLPRQTRMAPLGWALATSQAPEGSNLLSDTPPRRLPTPASLRAPLSAVPSVVGSAHLLPWQQPPPPPPQRASSWGNYNNTTNDGAASSAHDWHHHYHHRTSPSQQQALVSPISDESGDRWSTESRSRQLSRSMSTRSEELFFTVGRRH